MPNGTVFSDIIDKNFVAENAKYGNKWLTYTLWS